MGYCAVRHAKKRCSVEGASYVCCASDVMLSDMPWSNAQLMGLAKESVHQVYCEACLRDVLS